MVTIRCVSCGTLDEIPDSAVGEALKCSSCGCRFFAHDAVTTAPKPNHHRALGHRTQWYILSAAVFVFFFVLFIVIISMQTTAPQTLSPPAAVSANNPPQVLNEPYVTSEPMHSGQVNYKLVQTFRDAWIKERYRYKTIEEQREAIALLLLIVYNDCPDEQDRQATIDYIKSRINDWQ